MSSETKVFEDRMNKAILALDTEYGTIRVGRANPHVLDKLTVDYYGTPTPINQVGNVTVPEARILMIQPWDTTMVKTIEKAIQTSDIGINPSNDGKVIRLVFPELTEEKRKEQSKEVKKKGEQAKVAIRNIRRDAMEAFKKQQKAGDFTEDDIKELEKEIQNLTDKFIKEIDAIIDSKIKEVMSV